MHTSHTHTHTHTHKYLWRSHTLTCINITHTMHTHIAHYPHNAHTHTHTLHTHITLLRHRVCVCLRWVSGLCFKGMSHMSLILLAPYAGESPLQPQQQQYSKFPVTRSPLS